MKYRSQIKLVRKALAVAVEKVQDDLQDELINYKNDFTGKDMFDTISICDF